LNTELSSFYERVQQRGVAILLTLLIEGMLILLLLSLAATPKTKFESISSLTTFSLNTATQTTKPDKAQTEPSVKEPTPPENAMLPEAPVPPEIAIPPSPNKGFIEMSSDDMAAGDIRTLPKYANAASEGKPADSDTASGRAPNGEPLYRAEWHREPTEGELAFYLPKSRPPGSWAIIACRTIADYQVDNCQSLGESPPGSGIAHALRRAAWQFRVRPPRVGNKPLVGAWVSIRFDFTKIRQENN
jgi:hypothetical protein